MQDLGSLTRDRTCAPCIGSTDWTAREVPPNSDGYISSHPPMQGSFYFSFRISLTPFSDNDKPGLHPTWQIALFGQSPCVYPIYHLQVIIALEGRPPHLLRLQRPAGACPGATSPLGRHSLPLRQPAHTHTCSPHMMAFSCVAEESKRKEGEGERKRRALTGRAGAAPASGTPCSPAQAPLPLGSA